MASSVSVTIYEVDTYVLKSKSVLTKHILENSRSSVGDNKSVGGGVQVGNINVHLLVLQSGHGADLGHEEDDVAHVDVVA